MLAESVLAGPGGSLRAGFTTDGSSQAATPLANPSGSISLPLVIALLVLCTLASVYAGAVQRAPTGDAVRPSSSRDGRCGAGGCEMRDPSSTTAGAPSWYNELGHAFGARFQEVERGWEDHGLLPHEGEPAAESPQLDSDRRARILAALAPEESGPM